MMVSIVLTAWTGARPRAMSDQKRSPWLCISFRDAFDRVQPFAPFGREVGHLMNAAETRPAPGEGGSRKDS